MLQLIFILLSVAATAFVCLSVSSLSLWLALPLFVGFMIGWGLLYLLLLWLYTRFLPRQAGGKDHPFSRWLLVQTIAWVLPYLRMRIKTEGIEKLPDVPFLLVGNHLSAFDPMVTIVALKDRNMAFISKPENMAIPFVGRWLSSCSYLSIDRDHPRNAVKTIHSAARFITERGLIMGIYPEGTRSRTGELLPFRDGAFKIATVAQCPVAVLTVRYEKRPLWGKTAVLQVVGVMDEAYVTANRTAAISATARHWMEAQGDPKETAE